MIAAALGVIAGQLNEALRRNQRSVEDPLVLSNLVEIDGSAVPLAANKLTMFLVNVEREIASRSMGRVDSGSGRLGLQEPPLHVNLLLMFAANFSGPNYPEALKQLGTTLAFFQARPVFDHQNSPELDRDIEKLVLELEPLNVADLGNLWGILGGHYVPSVMYRLRMITITPDSIGSQVPPIRRPAASLGG